MNEQDFWRIIEELKPDVSRRRMVERLVDLSAKEIEEWDDHFGRLLEKAYTNDLMGACCLLMDGASDDTFYYFLNWLIAQGQSVYEAAIMNADSLAEVVSRSTHASAVLRSAAIDAWLQVTGKSQSELFKGTPCRGYAIDEAWNQQDEGELARRLPQLYEKCN